jgi:tellurite resistance protein TehA-like permease
VVFPLGMYAVCTQTVIRVFSLPLLEPIAEAFVWIALGAWALTLVGLARYALIACPSRGPVQL